MKSRGLAARRWAAPLNGGLLGAVHAGGRLKGWRCPCAEGEKGCREADQRAGVEAKCSAQQRQGLVQTVLQIKWTNAMAPSGVRAAGAPCGGQGW